MTPEAWVALGVGACSLAGSAIGFAVVHGFYRATIDNHTEQIGELKTSRKEQWEMLNEHESRITRVETACEIRHGGHNGMVGD